MEPIYTKTHTITNDEGFISGTAAELLESGASLEQVRTAFPGSEIIDDALVLEPGTIYADDGNAEIEYTDMTAAEAARDYVDSGDWGEAESTQWIDVWTYRKGLDEDGDEVQVQRQKHTVTLHPAEPKCTNDAGHDWQSPHEVVGGLEENPGVRGHGGGVIMTEVCVHCGTLRITDTWAQRPDTGEQGLESVRYQNPGED